MGRLARSGSFDGIVAVALIAHLWMFPALLDPPPHADALATTAIDTPVVASCATGMAACVATGAEELRLPLAVMVSSLPVLLWALSRRPRAARLPTRSSRHRSGPPLTPVDARVVLLE